MTQCPTCGSNVQDSAHRCPDCGMVLSPDLPSGQPSGQAAPSAQPQPVESGMATVNPAGPADPSAAEPSAAFLSAPPGSAPGIGGDARSVPAAAATIGLAPVASAAPVAAMALASLTLKRGGAVTSEKFVLGPTATIGRFDPASGPVDVDIGPLPEAIYVSRHHASIRRDAGGGWFIKDMGSRNGTFVRQAQSPAFERITSESALADGDEVSLGNARFVFRIGA